MWIEPVTLQRMLDATGEPDPVVTVWPSTSPPEAKRAPRGTWADDGGSR